jgi:hypothetical protein
METINVPNLQNANKQNLSNTKEINDVPKPDEQLPGFGIRTWRPNCRWLHPTD